VIPGKRYTPELVVSVAWRRKWLIVIPAVVIAAIACAVTYRLPDTYRAQTTILVIPQRIPEAYVQSTVNTRIDERLRSIDTQVRSRTRLEQIIEQFNLFPERRKTDIMQDIVDDMSDSIKVDMLQDDVFRISYIADSPRTAQQVTERLGSFFIEQSVKDRAAIAEDASQFLEAREEDTTRKLRETEQKLAAYRQAHDGELPTQANANQQGLMTTQGLHQNVVAQLDRDREEQTRLNRRIQDLRQLADNAAAAPVLAQDAPQSKAAQLQAERKNLQQLSLKYGPGFPEYDRTVAKVATLEKEAAEEAASQTALNPQTPVVNATAARYLKELSDTQEELNRLRRQMDTRSQQERSLIAQMGQYQRRIELAPVRDAELVELMREYGVLQAQYNSMATKRADSEITATLEQQQLGEQFKILDPARLPEKPFSPNRERMYMLSILAAIALGIALAAGAEYLDRGLRSEDDVRLALALPVLATIPVITPAKGVSLRTKLFASSAAKMLVMAAGAAWWS
jgi:polysaccharide chain length determinant protein (PEP-CTERM system associated)